MNASIVLVALGLASFTATTAQAQGPGDGRPLAERWCMACHVIEREPLTVAPDRGPSFPVIAARPGMTPEQLRRYLSTGHTHMPDFALSRYESDALIAYVLSLR
jgi:mono/diheme cytochrome c family protein